MLALRLCLWSCALASITCCPSLFLTVTKGEPGPRPALPQAVAADVPFETPRGIVNRFDVLDPTAAPSDYADYDEAATDAHAIASLGALKKIWKKFGTTLAPDFKTSAALETEACVICPDKCDSLIIKGPAALPASDAHVFLGANDYLPAHVARIEKSLPIADVCDAKPGDTEIALSTPIREVSPGTRVKIRVGNVPLADTITSFVQVSDIQIRDPDVRLGDKLLSQHLDKLIPSFEYDHDLEFYDRYVVEALFATINKIVDVTTKLGPDSPERPAFVIHTGDAIDSGVTTELREFHRLFDSLKIPAYDVIGNHDVLVFGNMLPTATNKDATCGTAISAAGPEVSLLAQHPWLLPDRLCVKQTIDCPTCLPGEAKLVAGLDHAQSHANFMAAFAAHTSTDVLSEPQRPNEVNATDPKQPPPPYCDAMMDAGGVMIEREIAVQRTTLQHGFDLNQVVGAPHAPGYYAFANEISIAGKSLHALYIVLDTNDLDPHEGGAVGRINTKQMAWLKNTLTCVAQKHPNDLVFAFGHHGLRETNPPANTNESVEHVLASNKNVVGYLYGHEHAHGICNYKGSCAHFWEVMTGSVIEFPQEARMVRVKYAGHGLGFLEVVTFGDRIENHGDDFNKAVELGKRGTERDYCENHDATECSVDQRPYRNDGRHTNARLFFRLPEFKD